ncbi:MAG TPA: PepSY domain-containing protein [Puia sp.]|nr:PepSY domain-containing protein [Puia sp.]
MRSKIYKWHRTFSLIIAIPVLLWASSGFMHPIMTNIRPKIATQGLPPVAIDSARIHVPLQAALRLHHLDSIANFRLVHIDTNWFYQVQLPVHRLPNTLGTDNGSGANGSGIAGLPAAAIPIYLSCTNGNVLPAGDWLYAQYLARQFLEGPATLPVSASHAHQSIASASSGAPASIAIAYTAPVAHDCCGAATETVLNPVKGAKVANVSLLKNYDLEYKSINKLLPVYRVSFDRPDGIRVYVETTRDRFAFAMDNRRMVFDRIFTLVHTWAWLEFLGKGKLAVEGGLALMAFLTALMGIYIFFATKSKKVNGNGLVRARRTHRYTSITIALFTLMFTFSGAFHAFSKFKEDTRDRFFVAPSFAAADLNFRFSQLQEVVKEPITDVSIVSIYGRPYWQVTQVPSSSQGATTPSPEPMAGAATHTRDLMKDTQAPAPSRVYLQTDSPYSALPQGEMRYAGFLACTFSGQPATAIRTSDPVLRFTSEYNFADKRLPVWKISYASNNNERYYVETSTGRLSKLVTDNNRVEEYSFAFLHKHEFMGWGGKTVKDISTMFWASAQIVLVIFGLLLYVRYRRRSPPSK